MNPKNHNIEIFNFCNNDTVCHSYILLKGKIITSPESECKKNAKTVDLEITNNRSLWTNKADCIKSKFNVLVELKRGENKIVIKYCCTDFIFTMYFMPKLTDYFIMPLYIICTNHDGKFQAPNYTDNSQMSACLRISIGIKLIQCLISEKFYENGLLRKTFQIEKDLYPEAPECRIFHSQLDANYARKMRQEELWDYFGRELLRSEFKNDRTKYVAFISCTHYQREKYDENVQTHDDIIALTEAHAALGGGGLAIFGSACLHTWPEKIQDVMKCFENKMSINRSLFMDDSCYRGTYGGCFSTTLGAVCHELCHTFDLGHTTKGVMGRGFDHIEKEFVTKKTIINISGEEHQVVPFIRNINVDVSHNSYPGRPECSVKEIKSSVTKTKKRYFIKNEFYWTSNCYILLYHHKWLNSNNDADYLLSFDDKKEIIKSSAGICIVEIRNTISEMLIKWWDFSEDPIRIFEIPDMKLYNFGLPVFLIAEDVLGNILKEIF